jgi:hypothetical protein
MLLQEIGWQEHVAFQQTERTIQRYIVKLLIVLINISSTKTFFFSNLPHATEMIRRKIAQVSQNEIWLILSG